jgi:hypothetical protein
MVVLKMMLGAETSLRGIIALRMTAMLCSRRGAGIVSRLRN